MMICSSKCAAISATSEMRGIIPSYTLHTCSVYSCTLSTSSVLMSADSSMAGNDSWLATALLLIASDGSTASDPIRRCRQVGRAPDFLPHRFLRSLQTRISHVHHLNQHHKIVTQSIANSTTGRIAQTCFDLKAKRVRKCVRGVWWWWFFTLFE
jgi:hypothetical protein